MYGNTVIIRIVDRGEADHRFASFSFLSYRVMMIFFTSLVEIWRHFFYYMAN